MSRAMAAWTAGALLLLSVPWGPVRAGETLARLEVRVADRQGRPVPVARVQVASPRRGDARAAALTDDGGVARFLLLPPAGDYRVIVSAGGFAPWASGAFPLRAGGLAVLDASVRRPGEPGDDRPETIPRLMDPESTGESTSFGAGAIERLPIIGRTYRDLLTLTPGVTDPDLDGSPNVEGARETGLQYRLDGLDVTDPVSGQAGMNLDFQSLEEVEVTPSGAGVSHGRAGGGFAEILTRAGGNDLEGTARLVYRGSFLDGETGAFGGTSTDYDDFHSSVTLGGPILRDSLWYFGSVRRLSARAQVEDGPASFGTDREGWDLFLKASWQAGPDHRLAFQVSADPRRYGGLPGGDRAGPESGYDWRQGGTAWQASWIHTPRPDLLVEVRFGGYDSGISTDPVSPVYHPFQADTRPSGIFGTSLQAVYPTRECSTDGSASGFIPNCDPALGRTSLYQVDLYSGRITGPSWFELDDERERVSARGDVTFSLTRTPAGEHLMGAGVEHTREKYEDDSHFNPILQDATLPCPTCRDIIGQPIPNAVTGFQFLTVPLVPESRQLAESENTAVWLHDTWKPLPNLAVRAGLRLDVEQVDADGLTSFDPAPQRRRFIRIQEDLCAEGLRALALGTPGTNTAGAVCSSPTFNPLFGIRSQLVFPLDPNTPRWIRRLDFDDDMSFNSLSDRLLDGRPVWMKPLTTINQVAPEPWGIRNENLSPRVGIAWDPRGDGRTRLFGSWGRYYDRIRLGVAALETSSSSLEFTFEPQPFVARFQPGQLSRELAGPSVVQVDRNLKTPRTDVLTLGGEREVAPGWSAGITYVQRKASYLQQDADLNHATCRDLDTLLGVSPTEVCPLFVDPNGRVVISDDLFGGPGVAPNGLVDLYAVNQFFNQVLRVESSDRSTYRAVTLQLRRRLLRGWSLSGAYTFSTVEGGGAFLASLVGDDPAVEVEQVVLDFDQRHRAIIYGTALLPWSLDLGWAVRWEGGVPYSRTRIRVDEDDNGNLTTRVRYPSGERNDRRGPDAWLVDARIAKHFPFPRITVSVELAAENLLGNEQEIVEGDSETISTLLKRQGRMMEAGLVFRF